MAHAFLNSHKSLRRRLSFVCLSLLLVISLSLTAFALETPDPNKPGSISLTMRCEGENVGGGTMTLYRVGDITRVGKHYFFTLTDFFSPSGVSLTDPASPEAAASLQRYAREHNAQGDTKTIGKDGNVRFPDILPGLYLLSQDKAAKGYNPAAPFLVSVPMEEDGRYVYDVNATPKVQLTPAPTKPTTSPTKPTTPGNKLPQTGQPVIPIFVLAALGLALVLVGWVVSRKERGSGTSSPSVPAPSDASDSPDIPDVPDSADGSDGFDSVDISDVPDFTDAPDVFESLDAEDVPDFPDMSNDDTPHQA